MSRGERGARALLVVVTVAVRGGHEEALVAERELHVAVRGGLRFQRQTSILWNSTRWILTQRIGLRGFPGEDTIESSNVR